MRRFPQLAQKIGRPTAPCLFLRRWNDFARTGIDAPISGVVKKSEATVFPVTVASSLQTLALEAYASREGTFLNGGSKWEVNYAYAYEFKDIGNCDLDLRVCSDAFLR